MKIVFLLPPPEPALAIGGYAVVYTYAGALAQRGHDVEVQHLTACDIGLRRRRAHQLLDFRHRSGPALAARYDVHPAVRLTAAARPNRRRCRAATAVIASAWQTAEETAKLGLRADQGFYLIQHHETWAGPAERVDATWRLPLTRLAIAGWLVDLGAELAPGSVTHHLPNAIDPGEFDIEVDPADRDRHHIGMLWHTSQWKGSAAGLTAFAEARRDIPQLHLTVLTTFDPPAELPPGVSWRKDPPRSQVADYFNSISIFLSPSRAEGWPLPPAEAMASGAALITTDIPGVHDYADQQVCVLVPADDPAAMAAALRDLVRDDVRRKNLALAGSARIRTDFSWERSTDRLEQLIRSAGPEAAHGGTHQSSADQPRIDH